MNGKKLLWISLFTPYDGIKHAGGKIENYYLKFLKGACPNIDIHVLSFSGEDEIPFFDLDKYNIDNDIYIYKKGVKSKISRTFKYNLLDSKYNPFNKYANSVSNEFLAVSKKKLKRYYAQRYKPDVIILQWTQAVFLAQYIKSIFPLAKIICIEEDVSYLRNERRVENAKNCFGKIIAKHKYNTLKIEELNSLKHADVVINNNYKDYNLLIKEGIDKNKLMVWCPYFDNYSEVQRFDTDNSIVFYGAMSREENYQSAIWFIENVMSKLPEEITLNVVGANPPKKLFAYENNRIHITGFVEDVRPYFSKALCLVVPLLLGAGIKIKVLEGMSAGVPILT